MTTLTLWAPGRSLPASPIDRSISDKKEADQSATERSLPAFPFDRSTTKKEDDRSALKNGSSEIVCTTPKKRSSQATLLQDQGEVCPILSNFVYLSNVSTLDYIEADTPQAWAQALQEIEAAGICGLDLETTGLDPLSSRARLCQLSLPSGRVYVADLWELGREGAAPLQDLGQLSERSDIKKVGHNLKFDLSFIQASQGRRLKMSNLFDTMLASQVCWAGYYDLKKAPKATKNLFKKKTPEQSLKALAERHLGISLSKELQASNWGADTLSPEQKAYAARDAAILLPLHDILQKLLQKNKLEHIAELEFRALPSVIELELQGLPLDTQACRSMMELKKCQAQAIAQSLQAEAQRAGFEPRRKKGKKYSPLLNPESSQDVLAFLQAQGHKISSTKEEDLKELSLAGCSFAGGILHYRGLSHQVAFMEDWLLKLSPMDGRLHPGYFQIQAATGRFSSREPNAQQIPKKGEDGQAIRKLFRAPPGKKLIKADFSGIELRIMACLSQDKTMLEAFQAGQDLHKLTASKVSGLPIEQITKTQRQGAKAVNFLLIYGGQPELLQRRAKETYGVEMSQEQAQSAHKMFFQAYPGVEAFHKKQRALKNCPKSFFFHNSEKGLYSSPLVCSQTVTGRKRVWGWNAGRSLASINQLYNSPSQGTGADLLKVVMAEVYSSLPEEVKMIGSVHDELILEAPEALAQEMATKLLEIMRRIGSELLSPVPVDAEVEVLDSWGGD
jgi:DNA polymerase-1